MSICGKIARFQKEHLKYNLGIEPKVGLDLYNLIIDKKIKTVVETGICYGYSSWYMLEALKVTGGKLWSIEAFPKPENLIVVPEELKKNWTRIKGACPQSLCTLLRELKKVDFFWHDSDHGFGVQFGEYVFASMHCTYIGSHDISRSGAWEAFLPLFGWKEFIHRCKYGIAKKDGTC